MNLDWIKMGVSAGGTGAITCTTLTGYADPTDYLGSSGSRLVRYNINDETNALREKGFGSFALATMVLTRTRVEATFNAGTVDTTSPSALNFGTSSVYVSIEPVADVFTPTIPFFAVASPAGDIGLRAANGTISGVNFTPSIDVEVYYPFLWTGQGEVVQAAIYCGTLDSGKGMKAALYEVGSDGLPGARLYVLGTFSLTSTGIVALTASPMPLYLPVGWYYMGAIFDTATARVDRFTADRPSPAGFITSAIPLDMHKLTKAGSYTTGMPDPASTGLTGSTSGGAPDVYLKPRNT